MVLEDGYEPLIRQLGLSQSQESIVSHCDPIETEDTLELLSHLSGIEIKNKAPTRIGGSMGRPEKANERRMKPPPNVLFPLGETVLLYILMP